MENWTKIELIEYRTELRKKIRQVRSKIKWYTPARSKKIQNEILKTLHSELNKVQNIIDHK